MLDASASDDGSRAQSDGEPCRWHTTYAHGSFRGDRAAITPAALLEQIQAEATPGAHQTDIGLIMPSTFHPTQERHKDLPARAEMLLYCAIADLDAEPHHAASKAALKADILKAIREGASFQELCAACPDFAAVAEAAAMLCEKLREKGFTPACWFTGGKGFRVAWWDPACFLQYKKGDKDVSKRVLTVFFKEYLGGEYLAAIQKLCDFDKNIYDAGKGVKSDLHQHQDTKLWPVLVDFSSADTERLQNMQMKRSVRDETLCQAIVAFWTSVLTQLPASWAGLRPVPGDTGADIVKSMETMKRASGRGESSSRGESASRAAKKAKREPAGRAENTLSDEELKHRLEDTVEWLVQISPALCGNYDDWIKAFFAVHAEMAGAGGADVHEALDAFSSIRPGYKGADDVARIYDHLEPRDDSQARVTVATLVHWARQAPALVLASQPDAKERAAFQALLDAMFRLSERREPAQSQCEADLSDLKKKLLEKRRDCQRHLLDLLWRHVDLSKTHWPWLTQFCSCLFDAKDREYIQHTQRHIIQEYGKRDICITAGDLESAWRRPKLRCYSNALVAYVQQRMRVSESANEDSEPAVDGSETDSIASGSTARCANPHKRLKIARGRASLLQAAQLLVQLPLPVLRQLLRRTRGTPCRLLNLLEQHLRDPSGGRRLVGSLQACFASLVGIVAVEIIEPEAGSLCRLSTTTSDDSDEDALAANVGDMHIDSNVPTHASIPSDTSSNSDSEGDDADAEDSLVLDENSTLESIMASHCALRLTEDWTTTDLAPWQMHAALLQNVSTGVDWRLVVVWTCLLISYQQQVKADAEAKKEAAPSEAEAGKEEAAAEKQAISEDENDTDADPATEVAAGSKLPEELEDYWEKIQGQQDAPTEQEVWEEWKKTLACIRERENSEHIMLIGRALWSACFNRLFSYQAVKSKFEQRHFKVNDLKTYFSIDSTNAPVQFNAPGLTVFHKSDLYWGVIGPNNQEVVLGCPSLENKFRKLTLTNRWMKDPGARAFDRIDSIPPSREGSAVPMNVYNTWPGFRAETLLPVPEAEVASLVQPILDHLRVLLGRSEYFDFFLAWLAQMVQDPSEPTHVAIVLKGQQGIGKDIIFEFFIKEVLGAGTGFKTEKPQEHIFGTHSVALQNRVFLLFDELSGDDIRPLMSRLKDLITSSTAHLNPKNKTAYDVRNLSNILATTNSENSVHIEPQERRFVVFECNASKKGDVAYFQSLLAHLKRDGVARAFFQHLRDHVDVRPHTPFQAHRPQTDAYLTMQQRSIPMLYKFLSAEIEYATGAANERRATVGGKDFFEKFLAWGRDGNYSTNGYTNSRFGTELGQLVAELTNIDTLQDSLVKRRANGGISYAVDWTKLRVHLQNTARYDPNAVM